MLVTAGAVSVSMDNQHVIRTKANGKIGVALVEEAKALGANAFLVGEHGADIYELIDELEHYKNQHPDAFFLFMRQIHLLLRGRLNCLLKEQEQLLLDKRLLVKRY